VIGAAGVVLFSALGDEIDYCAAIIAVFRRIVITQDLDFGDSVLVDAHAQFVRSARLAPVQTVNGSDGRTTTLPADVGQVGAETFAYGFNVIYVGRSGHQPQERSDVAPFGRDQRDLVGGQPPRQVAALGLDRRARSHCGNDLGQISDL